MPPGTTYGAPAGRTPASAGKQSGVASRADVIKRAEQLFVQGQWKKAAELMAKAAGFFVGDEEITALLTQYREKANQLDEVLTRMATLGQQNRWCEVSQILAELQQTGVSIKGLEQYAAAAQQEICSFAAARLNGQNIVAARTYCRGCGAREPRASICCRSCRGSGNREYGEQTVNSTPPLAPIRCRPLTLACLAAFPPAVPLFMESCGIEKARRQITNKEYEDALKTVDRLPHRWFVEHG